MKRIVKEKLLRQDSFILRLNQKAESYTHNEGILSSVFDEFVTRFIVFNLLYKFCAEELSYSSKTWEKTKAVEAVYITLKSKSIALMHAISPYIKTMYDAIIKNHFTIDNTNQDDKILKGMSSSNDEEKLKSTLTCLYKLRCNLIHGDKEYMEEQRTILTAANKCLEILNQELYLSLKN